MRRSKLDKIDRRILRDLQADGRMTNVELAQRAGISAPPCLRRVRTLEEAGLIRGYHADINAEALGFGITVFALVGLASQAEIDFLLKIVAADWDSYQRFLAAKLTPAPNVKNVRSMPLNHTAKFEPGVPIDAD